MAADLPPNAHIYLPMLKQEQVSYWHDHYKPTLLAGQVEQESCVSLKSLKCWSPYAELNTNRERGVGLSQFTKTATFDAIEEIKRKHPSLFGNWSFDNPYSATYQLRGLVVYMHDLSSLITGAATQEDQYKFALSSYNGGIGGLRKDRMLCAMTKGCDENRWAGNVELVSTKSKKPFKGYGQSSFDINRGYVTQIYSRAKKYEGNM